MAEQWKLLMKQDLEEVKGEHEAKMAKEVEEFKKPSSYDRAMNREKDMAILQEHEDFLPSEHYIGIRHDDRAAKLNGHNEAFIERVKELNTKQLLDIEPASSTANLSTERLEKLAQDGKKKRQSKMRADREASNLSVTSWDLKQTTAEDTPNVLDEDVLRHLEAARENEAWNEAAMRLEQLGGGGGLGSPHSAQSQGTTDPPLQLSSSNVHQSRYPNVGCWDHFGRARVALEA